MSATAHFLLNTAHPSRTQTEQTMSNPLADFTVEDDSTRYAELLGHIAVQVASGNFDPTELTILLREDGLRYVAQDIESCAQLQHALTMGRGPAQQRDPRALLGRRTLKITRSGKRRAMVDGEEEYRKKFVAKHKRALQLKARISERKKVVRAARRAAGEVWDDDSETTEDESE